MSKDKKPVTLEDVLDNQVTTLAVLHELLECLDDIVESRGIENKTTTIVVNDFPPREYFYSITY